MAGVRKILIVDDDPMLRRLLRATLTRRYQIAEAADGDEAVEAARREQPDLIVMDVRMPHLNGIAACERIKQPPAICPAKILMLTVYGRIADMERARSVGADGYLVKPYSPPALLGEIERLLAG